MKDRADYARKGIARGRSLVAFSATDGIVIVAENPSRTLYKISEIYDRIAFAGVGKYNEFEMLKIAGVRHADMKGYQFSREDVNARVARERLRADARPGVHPRDEAVRGRDPGRPGRRRPRPTTSCSTSSTTARSWTSRASRCSVARPRSSPTVRVGTEYQPGSIAPKPCGSAPGSSAGPSGPLPAVELEVAVLHGPPKRARFTASRATSSSSSSVPERRGAAFAVRPRRLRSCLGRRRAGSTCSRPNTGARGARSDRGSNPLSCCSAAAEPGSSSRAGAEAEPQPRRGARGQPGRPTGITTPGMATPPETTS